MAILKKSIPLLIIPLLASCEEVFTPDVPYTPVLCMNSLITAGQPVETKISKSRLYTDNPDQSVVSDAEIRIYANGEAQPADYLPAEGDQITIVAESPTVGTAEADITVPTAVKTPTASWEASDVMVWESENNTVSIQFNLKVKLSIEDRDGEDFYKFSFYSLPQPVQDPDNPDEGEYYGFSIGSLNYNMEPIFSEHINIFESIMGGEADRFSVFTDRQFAGRSYTLNLQFYGCWYMFPKGTVPDCAVNLNVSSISPSYYSWCNYMWQRDNSMLTDFSDYGLGDPVWGYSNVSTGAGVVAAQSSSICTIDLTDWVKQVLKQSGGNADRI